MKFQGQLDEDVLVNLLQYLHLNRASGMLLLLDPRGSRGHVFTRNGQVVHASTDDAEGVQALVTLLKWQQGRFAFQPDVTVPRQTIDIPLDALLLQVAYRRDLRDSQVPHLGERSVLVPTSITGMSPNGSVALSLIAIKVLPLLDGRLSLGEIQQRLKLPFAEVHAAARDIVRNGLAAVRGSAPIDSDFIADATVLMRDIMGPLADIVVEDALYEMELTAETVPESQLPELLGKLRQEFQRDDWREEFTARLGPLLAKYGLEERV